MTLSETLRRSVVRSLRNLPDLASRWAAAPDDLRQHWTDECERMAAELEAAPAVTDAEIEGMVGLVESTSRACGMGVARVGQPEDRDEKRAAAARSSLVAAFVSLRERAEALREALAEIETRNCECGCGRIARRALAGERTGGEG